MTESTTSEHLIAVDFDPFAGPDILSLAPATESQTEIWTSCQLGTDDANRAYNESCSLRLTGPLQREAFEKAFGDLVRRHEGLRTAFSADGLQMVVFQDVFVPVDWLDCSDRPGPEREECVRDYTRQAAHHLFDLTYGPLIKASLIRLSDTITPFYPNGSPHRLRWLVGWGYPAGPERTLLRVCPKSYAHAGGCSLAAGVCG